MQLYEKGIDNLLMLCIYYQLCNDIMRLYIKQAQHSAIGQLSAIPPKTNEGFGGSVGAYVEKNDGFMALPFVADIQKVVDVKLRQIYVALKIAIGRAEEQLIQRAMFPLRIIPILTQTKKDMFLNP